jgi:hypothetical protein
MSGIFEADDKHQIPKSSSAAVPNLAKQIPLASVGGFLYTCEHCCAIVDEAVEKC